MIRNTLPVRHLSIGAVLWVAVVALPASGAVLLGISHDGTAGDENNPFDSIVRQNNVDWAYTTDGARSIMTAVDSSTSSSANNRLITIGEDGVSQFTDTGTAAGKGWVFEVELEFLAGVGESGGGFAYFGVRSENGAGKSSWITVSEAGGTGDKGQIGFADSTNNFYGGHTEDLDVDSLIGDGQYHNFTIRKYDDGGGTTVDVSLDGSLVLSAAYSALQDDVNAMDIQGFASSTPTPSSEVNIDQINFTLYDNLTDSIPEPNALILLGLGAGAALLRSRRRG